MRILGQEIPAIGMGCWAIGGAFYAGDQPLGFANVHDKVSTQTIHAALDCGIRLFDTAAVYGAGHAERLLGEALKNRDDAFVVTKIGMAFDEQTKQLLGNEPDSSKVASAIEASLRRLQRDSIDILLLHINELPMDIAEPIFAQMEEARLEGKIRAYGWSTDYPESVQAMANHEAFVCVEHAMNIFMDVPTIQSTIETHKLIGLIRSPLAMGVLTGKYTEASVLSGNDCRAFNTEWRDYFHDGKVTPKYLDKISTVRELLQTGGRSVAQGSLGWLLAKSPCNLPLPGARTVEQIQENAAAIELGALPDSVMEEIDQLIQREPEGAARAR